MTRKRGSTPSLISRTRLKSPARDEVFFGHSEDLLENYLLSVFRLIEANADARDRMERLLQTPRTFENIVGFLSSHRGLGLPVSG